MLSNVKCVSSFFDVRNNDRNLPLNFTLKQPLTIPRVIKFCMNSIELGFVNTLKGYVENFLLWGFMQVEDDHELFVTLSILLGGPVS